MKKYLGLASIAAAVGSFVASIAGATILTPPNYSDVVNTTTTAFGGSLFTDLLPWLGIVIVVIFVGLVLGMFKRYITKMASKLLGGRRGGRGGRRRYR